MKKINEPKYPEKIFFRATSKQAELIKAAADQDNRTVSNWIRMHIDRVLQELETSK